MAVTIAGVALQGDAGFDVNGTTSVPGTSVRCQAFIGQTAASAETSTVSGRTGSWATTLTLYAAYESTQQYRVVAIADTEDGTEVTVPPFFGG